jgi:hypothetical protein
MFETCTGTANLDNRALPREVDEFELVPERNDDVNSEYLLVWLNGEPRRDGKELGPECSKLFDWL